MGQRSVVGTLSRQNSIRLHAILKHSPHALSATGYKKQALCLNPLELQQSVTELRDSLFELQRQLKDGNAELIFWSHHPSAACKELASDWPTPDWWMTPTHSTYEILPGDRMYDVPLEAAVTDGSGTPGGAALLKGLRRLAGEPGLAS